MDELMHGYIDRTHGSMDGCMDGCIDGWFDGWMGVVMYGWMCTITKTISAWARLH
jgi:hypothetical protein